MYLSADNNEPVLLDNGTLRTVMAHNQDLMIVRFEFKKGQQGLIHSHHHAQSTYILKGKFQFFVGDRQYQCSEGDTLIAESYVDHGCVCLEDGILIDNFTPSRDDFLKK